jgi:hypothetical protein
MTPEDIESFITGNIYIIEGSFRESFPRIWAPTSEDVHILSKDQQPTRNAVSPHGTRNTYPVKYVHEYPRQEYMNCNEEVD